jgi:hypothetical protein
MENKAYVNIINTIDRVPTDIVNEPNNTKDATHIEPVVDTTVKIVNDSKWINDYSTGYELREENTYTIKREQDELFYGTDSKCPKLFNDINKVFLSQANVLIA